MVVSLKHENTTLLGPDVVEEILALAVDTSENNRDYRNSLQNHLTFYIRLLEETEGGAGTVATLAKMYQSPMLVLHKHLLINDSIKSTGYRRSERLEIQQWFNRIMHMRTDLEGNCEIFDVMEEHVRTLRQAIEKYEAAAAR